MDLHLGEKESGFQASQVVWHVLRAWLEGRDDISLLLEGKK
jgi:hypothetical protein